MNKTKIYILSRKDISKNMQKVFIGTSILRLKRKIAIEIASGNMAYNSNNISPDTQVSQFLKDWNKRERGEKELEEIIGKLINGKIEILYNNEEIA